MKITSRASDYALLLVMYLAALAPEETTSVKRVAESLGLSTRFLANIANKLAIARILLSSRGVGGGIKLARPAAVITVSQIIEAVDGPVQTMFCQNTEEICCHEIHCSMKPFWSDLQYMVMNKLRNTSIDTLVQNHGGRGPGPMPKPTHV